MGELVDPALLNGRGTSTEWMNLGWWAGTLEYTEAAAALARQVGYAARLTTGDQILDVGCGAGDSTALWIREFGAAQVVGIEPDAPVAARARRRIATWRLDDRITIDARSAESFDDAGALARVSAVVSVDAAYHIETRARWLERLSASCGSGTRLGLFDIALRDAADRARFSGYARRAGIPAANLWSVDEIVPTLNAAGFTDVSVRRCEAEVFAGFIRFACRKAVPFASHPGQGGWRALATATMLASAGAHLAAVVIGAERTTTR
ncbi:MAG: methyltransferase domain-containing protein [Gemmatimonadota bacterium]|nr:methyltransferase domain-containing protein [Gemmatimonadota bacterium]